MSTENSEAMARIAETATDVAADAERRAEIAEEQRDRAIEDAAEQREAAAEAAAEIARAAMENEQGRRIEGVERGLSECQSRMAGMETALQEIQTRLAAPPPIVAISQPPANSSLIPPASEQGTEIRQVETVATEILPPESASEDGPPAVEQEQPRKKRRLL